MKTNTNTDHITIGRNINLTLAVLHGVAAREAERAKRAARYQRLRDAVLRLMATINSNPFRTPPHK